MCKRKGFSLGELLIVLGVITILLLLLMPAVRSVREAAERTQARQAQRAEEQRQKDAWPFEKYFEDRGNGIYHLDGQKTLKDIPTTEALATVIGEWRKYHPELRILSITATGDDRSTFIIVTEPK